jgi:hypothetical protein
MLEKTVKNYFFKKAEVHMKKKTHCYKRFVCRYLIVITIIALIIATQLVSAQTTGSVADDLRQLINEARELLRDTHVAESRAAVPVGEYGATHAAHTELENAIAAAQLMLDLYGVTPVSTLEVNGTRVSKSITQLPDGYIDVTLTLDENPGIYSFLADLIFDEAKLTPVSIEHALCERQHCPDNPCAGDFCFHDFSITLPPITGGRYENRRIFVAIGTKISYDIGVIATTRFRVNEPIDHVLPIAIGRLEVVGCDGSGGIESFSVSTDSETLMQQGIDVDALELSLFSTPMSGTVIGDINRDGKIDLYDTTLLARYIQFFGVVDLPSFLQNFNTRAADVNMDGAVDLLDLILLVRWIAGHDVTLGPPPLTMNYRILVNSDGDSAGRIRQAESLVNQVAPFFKQALNTTLILQQPGSTSQRLNMRGDCLGPVICGPDPRRPHLSLQCGNVTGSNCQTVHHRSASYLVSVERDRHTFKFVDYRICYYFDAFPGRQPFHDEAPGLALRTNNLRGDLIVSLGGDNLERSLVHEISHLLGAPDHSCLPNQQCVMRYTDTIIDEWCDNCIDAIVSTRR